MIIVAALKGKLWNFPGRAGTTGLKPPWDHEAKLRSPPVGLVSRLVHKKMRQDHVTW